MALNYNVFIGANTKKFVEEFGKVKVQLTAFDKGMKKIGGELKSFGSVATKSLTVPIAGVTTALALATKEAAKFEKGMREVKTLLPNLSEEGFKKLTKEANEFAKEMGIMPEEITKAMYQAISAGIPQENVFDFLKTASQASIGGVTDLTTAVDGLTNTVNIYGSVGVSAGKAADIMFTSVRLGKTTFGELSTSLGGVSSLARSTGVSFEELNAAVASLTTQGRTTSEAATQIKSVLKSLANENSVTGKTFKELSGKSFNDFIASGKNLQDALKLMEDAAKKNGKSITSMFSEMEAQLGVLGLTGEQAKKLSDFFNEMKNSTGAAEKAFADMEESFSRQMQKLAVEINALVVEIGLELIPIVQKDLIPVFKKDIVPLISNTADVVSKLVTRFSEMPGPLKSVTIGAIGLAASIGPLSSILGSVTIAGVKAAKAHEALVKAMMKTAEGVKILRAVNMLTPVGAIVGITGLLTAFAVSNYQAAEAERKLIETHIKATREAGKLLTVTKDTATATLSLAGSYDEIAKKSKLTREEQEKQEGVIAKLKELYPDLNIEYDKNGKVIGSLTDQVKEYIKAKVMEADAVSRTAKQNIESEIKNKKDELAKTEESIKKIKDSGGLESKVLGSQENRTFVLEEQIKTLEEELINLDKASEEAEQSFKDLLDYANTPTPNPKVTLTPTTVGGGDEELKEKIKTFSDYIKELEAVDKKYALSIEQLKKLGKDIEADKELENKKEDIKKIIEEMAGSIKLSAKEMETLKKSYGYVFDGIEIDKIAKVKKAVEDNIAAYEKEVDIRKKLGETIKDEDIAKEKTEILKNTVVDLAKELKLTDEQVATLIESFNGLTTLPVENIKEKIKGIGEAAGSAIDAFSNITNSISSLEQAKADRDIENIERRKKAKLDAIDDEEKAKLKSLNAEEKSEKQKIKESLKSLKDRKNVAIGLYEQELLDKQIAEEEAELARLTLEEEIDTQRKEAEKNFENEKLRVQYESQKQAHAMQVVSATASLAKAGVDAVTSAMAAGTPLGVLAALVTHGTAVIGAGIQLGVLKTATPQAPVYLAEGGFIPKVNGGVHTRINGVNAVVGEGRHNEVVIPLNDDVLSSIGKEMKNATDKKNIVDNSTKKEVETITQQPITIEMNGKAVIDLLVTSSKRGIKIIHKKGIIE